MKNNGEGRQTAGMSFALSIVSAAIVVAGLDGPARGQATADPSAGTPSKSGSTSHIEASPTAAANGAPIGPSTAFALQPSGATRQPTTGPLTPLSNILVDHGINLRAVLINQFAADMSGGVSRGVSNTGQLNFGADVNLETLVGMPGASLHTTIYHDYGLSLAKQVSGTYVKEQNIYKNPYDQLHFGLLAYEQKLINNRLDILAGRIGSTALYGHLVSSCAFQTGAVCNVSPILNGEAGLGLLPSATWGINITVHPTRDTYIETGASEVNPTTQATNGLNWSTHDATGVSTPIEFGWTRPSLRTQVHPFALKFGAYITNAPHADPYYNTKGQSLGLHGGTAKSDAARDGIYVLGERVMWRPNPRTNENLNTFFGYTKAIDMEEVISSDAHVGGVLTGAIPWRPSDSIGFVGSWLQVSPREFEYLRDSRIKAGGSGANNPNELVFELNYGCEIIHNVRLIPNLQYIVNPDNANFAKINFVPKNVLVFGLYLTVGVSNILGFASLAGGSE